jgi:protein involved in polysaccharide export with SLBB domain
VAVSCCPVVPPQRVNEIYREVLEQRHNHYKIKDGDTVTVKLYNRVGDLNQASVVVLADGRADLFFMDNMKLAGKTLAEVEAELKTRIAAEVRDAEVSVLVTPRGERVYMVGQFERPGFVDLTTKMTMHEAVSAVGGLRITGDTDYALLRRPFMNPWAPDLHRIDLNDETQDIFLLPGDQIVLDRTWLATVIAYIREYLFGWFPPYALPWAAMGVTM